MGNATQWQLIVFLQRCALRSQDFAIFHREYIGFENPYQIRMLLIRILHPHWIRTQKSVRNLIVTKIKTSEQKNVTTEFLRKSACGYTICRLDFIMRIAVKVLKNQCQDFCAYGNSPDSTKWGITCQESTPYKTARILYDLLSGCSTQMYTPERHSVERCYL